MTSDDHLEQALEEYNARVTSLSEDDGDAYVEALVSRGIILAMMESYISATDDFDEAIEIMEESESSDAGTYIKANEWKERMHYSSDPKAMTEDCRKIASRLSELNTRSRFYDMKSIVEMCLTCADDLMELSEYTAAEPFIEKAFSVLGSKMGDWEDNRRADVHSMRALIALSRDNDLEKAIKEYTDAINIQEYLDRNHLLEERRGLVADYGSRAEAYDRLGKADEYISDLEKAIELYGEMLDLGQARDVSMMENLCKCIAAALVSKGKMAESEKYLVKAMKYGIPRMGEAMDNLGIKKSV